MTKFAIIVCSHLAFLETGSQTIDNSYAQTECICFADSAMIMHVLESAEVSLCGLRNISRTACNVYSGAQETYVP